MSRRIRGAHQHASKLVEVGQRNASAHQVRTHWRKAVSKLIKISEHKAFKVQPVLIKGEKLISVRQMYTTKNDPEWKHGKAGITTTYEELRKVFKRAKALHEDEATEYEDIFGELAKPSDKESKKAKPAKSTTKKKKVKT
ncbi:ssDNA binding protein [Achromobacter phage Motura]|uniref:SsDNA binding protein n=1 Tax=Achromobacter phage Motura TaxID=2591403 RepID=A0A514CSY0_9CAUD|nr:ssDNA binding protein [Achromobacter phage Motura]QDH83575.1 ssDNA binding protein [Achromobacter phage Motura]